MLGLFEYQILESEFFLWLFFTFIGKDKLFWQLFYSLLPSHSNELMNNTHQLFELQIITLKCL